MSRDAFAQGLIAWQREHGRHDLPWQRHPTPYRVWVSEIMLQQTQVATVIPYFERFMQRFPALEALAAADLDEVLSLWSGLGYYARARNLHRAARLCVERHGGALPRDMEALIALPGIGRSTAGAILALAFDEPHPILDGNARRVLARFHAVGGWPGRADVSKRLWTLAEQHTPRQDAAAYTQAIMDLGARLCTRSKPDCPACPVARDCLARHRGNPEAYPGRKAAGRRPHRETAMVILHDHHGRVLLQRRPPAGVWGGLWSLPEVDAGADVASSVADELGVPMRHPRRLPTLRHGFTHFTLDIQPWTGKASGRRAGIMDADRHRWLAPGEALELGVPRPVRTLLEQIANPTCRKPSTA